MKEKNNENFKIDINGNYKIDIIGKAIAVYINEGIGYRVRIDIKTIMLEDKNEKWHRITDEKYINKSYVTLGKEEDKYAKMRYQTALFAKQSGDDIWIRYSGKLYESIYINVHPTIFEAR